MIVIEESSAPVRRQKLPPVSRDWVSKTLAGFFLGLAFALAVSGVFSELMENIALATRIQLAMWMVPPIWMMVFGFVYFFTSGFRAWIWLMAVNVLAWGTFLALRQI
jgi:hypothetical protein